MEREIEVYSKEISELQIPKELIDLRLEVVKLREDLRHANNEMMGALNNKDAIVAEMKSYMRDAERYRVIVHLLKSMEGLDIN